MFLSIITGFFYITFSIQNSVSCYGLKTYHYAIEDNHEFVVLLFFKLPARRQSHRCKLLKHVLNFIKYNTKIEKEVVTLPCNPNEIFSTADTAVHLK